MGDLNSYLKKGAEIEISEADFAGGSWYLGTFISRSKAEKNKLFVEYKTLMNEIDGKTPLREKVDIVQLRPPAPRETSRGFRVGEQVDAYYNHGWWEGVITRVCHGVYTVFFRGTREEFDFRLENLRLHREWVKGVWVPTLENHKVCARQEEPRKNREQSGTLNQDRPVNKNWIVGLWLLLVLQICLAVYMDISVFYLLLKYNPEDLYYGFVVMLVLNVICAVVMGSQAQWLVERS